MQLGYNLTLEQTQKLVMTPELRQAIQLLQFTNQELNEYLEEQIQENPMLDISSIEEKHESIDELDRDKGDIDWKEYIEQYEDTGYRPQIDRNEEEYNYENFITESQSLREYLLFQLNTARIDEVDRGIGNILIESIDENGYLMGELDQIASDLAIAIARVENVLHLIQTFEPIGVGARNLKECLLIQVRNDGYIDSHIELLIEEHLEDIANNRLTKISKELDIGLEEVQFLCDYIRTLEPKPGRAYSDNIDDVKYIIPDATIRFIDGEYIILLNDITGPRLNINHFYRNLIRQKGDSSASEYLTEKLNSAMWIIRSIEQRRQTIYNVIESILKFQRDFFDKGKLGLKPLTLKEVAEDIGMHESTVSRATSGKYVQTPRGLYELKYFFTSGVSTDGQDMSSTSIKVLIKELIDEEDSKKPYSDQRITDILKKKGIQISRRTVAKYRDELEIPSSTMRRRY
ncbi:MAG: RNA polymerase factor sigma-54 [Tissierellia bacterium]|nr:RNA polymerase factor sigma-54 [Tissierellia bacterium]